MGPGPRMLKWCGTSTRISSLVVKYLGYNIHSRDQKFFLPEENLLKKDQQIAMLQTKELVSIRLARTVCIIAAPWACLYQRSLQFFLLRVLGWHQEDPQQPRKDSKKTRMSPLMEEIPGTKELSMESASLSNNDNRCKLPRVGSSPNWPGSTETVVQKRSQSPLKLESMDSSQASYERFSSGGEGTLSQIFQQHIHSGYINKPRGTNCPVLHRTFWIGQKSIWPLFRQSM